VWTPIVLSVTSFPGGDELITFPGWRRPDADGDVFSVRDQGNAEIELSNLKIRQVFSVRGKLASHRDVGRFLRTNCFVPICRLHEERAQKERV
jgi:hypothetical protein